MEKKKKLYFAIAGAVVGFINGFFGGGGGMVVLPVLTMLFKFEQKNAHATAIAIILPITVVSAVSYLIANGFKIFNFNLLSASVGVTLGGIVGALALKKIDNTWLVKIFSVVMFIAGAKLLFF